jgi:hypothetical protein
MTVSDILDGAFKLMKANVRTIAVIVAVFVVPLYLLAGWFGRDAYSVSFLDAFNDPAAFEAGQAPTDTEFIGQVVVGLVNLLVLPFIAGAISLVVAASYLGEDLAPGVALRRTAKRFWSLLFSWIGVHLLQISGFVVLGILAAVAAVLVSGIVAGLLVFAAIVVGIAVLIAAMGYFVLVAPAVVVEELGPGRGMRRSWQLVRGRFWPVFGTSILAGLISAFIASALTVVPLGVAQVAPEAIRWVIVSVFQIVSSIITQPIVAIVATLLYFDARIRKEGFDLQVIASELSSDRGPIS